MAKCPSEPRVLREFNPNCRNQVLMAIPMIQHGDYGDRLERRLILSPHPLLDKLYAKRSMPWFGTKTFLFPRFSKQMVERTGAHCLQNQTLLISFASMDDAMIARFLLADAIILPEDWWLEFEDAEYRRHPVYEEFEVTETALIRVDGKQLDTAPQDRMKVRSRKLTSPVGWEDGIRRSVNELVQDTWCVPAGTTERKIKL